MNILLKQGWQRFKSKVPPFVKKIQIIVGAAAVMFGGGVLITWPEKLAIVGSICSYGTAICVAVPLVLQFLQQTATVFETKTELTITKTTTSTEVPVDDIQK